MLQPRRLVIYLLLAMAALPYLASAQTASLPPTIIDFRTDLSTVTVDEAESGTHPVALTWQTVGMTDDHQLVLETYILDNWQNALPDDMPPLPASGSLVNTVPHTLSFQPPTLRLSILDSQGQRVDEWLLTIPYEYEIDSENPPQIVDFRITTSAIDPAELSAGTALVPVEWAVKNRPPDANLVFEQLLPDNTVVSVELPREHLWIGSTGSGVIQPIAPAGSDTVRLRLRLINPTDETVYAARELSIPIGQPLMPTSTPTPESTDNESNDEAPVVAPTLPVVTNTSPEIISFTTSTALARRGESITLSWQTRHASQVWIEIIELYEGIEYSIGYIDQLSLSGSTTISILSTSTFDAIRYRLVLDEFDFNNTEIRGPNQAITVIISDESSDGQVLSFSANPTIANPGDTVTLTWETRNAEKVWIEYADIDRSLMLPGGNFAPEGVYSDLPLNGSLEFTIPEEYEGRGIRFYITLDLYEFRARGPGSTREVFIRETNTTSQTTSQAAFQAFQGGYMFWRADTDDIWVFYGLTGGQSATYPLTTYESLPDNPVPDTPPAGFIKPTRGFGRVWGNDAIVRNSLGWAIGPEEGYTATITTFSGEATGIAFSLPDGHTISVVIDTFNASWGFTTP